MSKIDGLLEGKDAQFPRDLGMQRMMSDIVVDLASMYLGGIMDRVHPSLFNLTDLRTGNEWSAAVLFPEINPMLVGSFQDLIILGNKKN